MYITTILSYSDNCTVLMLNVYMYEYYTLCIYIALVFSYQLERGIIKKGENDREKRRKEEVIMLEKNAETAEEENFEISIRGLEFLDSTLNLIQVILDINKDKALDIQTKE